MQPMFFWSRFPFVRIAVVFMAGIVLSVFIPGYQVAAIGMALSLGITLIVLHYSRQKIFFHYNWLFGLAIVLLSLMLGYLRLFQFRDDTNRQHLLHREAITAYKAVVVSQPVQKGKFFRATVKLVVAKAESWLPTKGKVNLYVRSDSTPFNYGDELLIKGYPSYVTGPKNPEEFNYKRYLSFLNVFHQHFVDRNGVRVLSQHNGNPLIASSLQLRHYFSKILKTHVHGIKELAIANALLLGNKDELDDEIKATYAASGAMHVLAVSGLHVGIIYFIILFILKHTLRERKKEWMVAVVAIPLLWAYAFITGLSPSVLRAVTLFSILALGKALNRKGGMVNMLAVSAFVLLVFNPFLLMQVGFQLSYVAVLGIIYIYPLIRRLLMPTKWFWIAVWDITAISIAAQIATFPLSILYFHRFAPYFLISNLFVIPAATLMVWLGVMLFAFSKLTFLAGGIGFLLEWLIRSVNYVLGIIYHLPGSNMEKLYLDIPQTWLWYGIILGFIVFVVERKRGWAIATGLCMVLLTTMVGIRWVQNNQARQVVVYNIPHHCAIDFIQSGDLFSIQDSSLRQMEDKIHFHIKPQRLLMGANSHEGSLHMAFKQLPDGKAMVWNGVSVFIKEGKEENDNLPFDIIIDKSRIHEVYLNNGLQEQHSSTYDISEKGALLLNIDQYSK